MTGADQSRLDYGGRSRLDYGGHSSPAPSGVTEDDRSSTFDSVDLDRDDSFWAVLRLIREFHSMEELASVALNRCKTSLAPIYRLQSKPSLFFHLPLSPLLQSLLEDKNSALSKFVEDQIVHGFLPVPGCHDRKYYRTSSSSFPGPYTVPPGLASITLGKVSESRKRSVSLSHLQISSLETMLFSVCEVTSWLDWWLSTCGGFREQLTDKARGNFKRSMLSGLRALEFLGNQGVTALSNPLSSHRDSLLLDARSTVPAEELAHLRFADLPSSPGIFPSSLLDSALNKMRAASNNALVQRTLHPPKIPRESSSGPSKARSSSTSSADRGSTLPVVPRSQQQALAAPFSSSTQHGPKKQGRKGKTPSSAAPAAAVANKRVPGKSPPNGVSPLLRVGGFSVGALEALSDNWSRFLGAICPEGRIPHPLQGFSSSPLLHPNIVPTYRAGSPRSLALRQEVEKMLSKDALEIVLNLGPGFYSHLFLVEKVSGGWRPVIDLSHLNKFVLQTLFKMEIIAFMLLSIDLKDVYFWKMEIIASMLLSIDLKDVYFWIPVHQSSRKLLRFLSRGHSYSSRPCASGCRLPLRSSPRCLQLCLCGHTPTEFVFSGSWTPG